MDDTKMYIRMSSEAHEIQDIKRKSGILDPGDFFWNGEEVCVAGMDYVNVRNHFENTNIGLFYEFAMVSDPPVEFTLEDDTITIHKYEYHLKTFANCIWLPRQDQIQDLILGERRTHRPIIATLIGDFRDWLFNNTSDAYKYLSIEQLWICFYMYKVHHKIWDSYEWINRMV